MTRCSARRCLAAIKAALFAIANSLVDYILTVSSDSWYAASPAISVH